MSAIEFDCVSFGYTEHKVFDGLSLDIEGNGVTCIVGPNGSGKSTLLKLASGLAAPHTGCVRVQGRDIGGLSAKQRACLVGLLAQQPKAAPMTVRQLTECGRHPHRRAFSPLTDADAHLIEHALEAAGTATFADRMLGELSGGQLQRAYLAMVLAQDTPIVLLDEPTAALDVSASFEVANLMRSLNREHGKAVIAVVHDLNLALTCADTLCVMSAGRVLAQGSPRDPKVLAAVEEAFDVTVELLHGNSGSAYGLFGRERCARRADLEQN